MSAHDGVHYPPWRTTRLNKLESIFGSKFFAGKRILEVGAGFGKIGAHIRDNWNGDVYFTEGRSELVDRINSSKAFQVDHDSLWSLPYTFDFIIHWGTFYHLDNWKDDLEITTFHLKFGGILAYEGEILDSSADEEVKVNEPVGDDQALRGVGTRPSALAVENELTRLGLKFQRYDDEDLNTPHQNYTWKLANTRTWKNGQRRFWIARK